MVETIGAFNLHAMPHSILSRKLLSGSDDALEKNENLTSARLC